MIRRALIASLVLSLGCAGRALPPEIVSLQALRGDPSLTGTQKLAFDRLAAADDLLVRARGEWDSHADERARRDAIMGQIQMKTALAILQGERAKERLATIAVESGAADSEATQVDQGLALLEEEVDMQQRLTTISAKIAGERKTLSQQLETTKKQAASERQKLLDQLASEKRHLEALDALRAADLDLKTADTMLAAEYAKAKYTATVGMLQEAHKQFDAGNWDEAIARAATARSEAASAIEVARPRYEQAERLKVAGVRDHALEEAASAIPGITMRFERKKDLQKLVLVLPRLFGDRESSFAPAGAKALDAVRDLLAAYPTYPIQVSGFTDDQGKLAELAASSLARANAVYWALVSRGIDPRRMNVDGRGAAEPIADNGSPSGRALNARIEIAILYHALQL
ncbi:MAG TPA: OmpA family protein [Polyangia bacterium]|jgi:outer membrane protein OmpA-like peptidoglycan-associated protein